MYKCEREEEVLSILNATGYATVEYLSKKMNISSSSVRRDLKNLEERGLVNRSYGGVRIAESGGKQVPFSLRAHENSTQKKWIAKTALGFISPGDVVVLDGSSSACFLAELLPSIPGITIITNSIDVMEILKNYDVKAYCTGGTLSPENRPVLVGGYAEEFLQKIRADVFIFSVQGVSSDGNLYDCYAEEVAVRNVILANAQKKILLCDSSKLGKHSIFLQGNIKDLNFIVCDKTLDSFFKDSYPEKFILAE